MSGDAPSEPTFELFLQLQRTAEGRRTLATDPRWREWLGVLPGAQVDDDRALELEPMPFEITRV